MGYLKPCPLCGNRDIGRFHGFCETKFVGCACGFQVGLYFGDPEDVWNSRAVPEHPTSLLPCPGCGRKPRIAKVSDGAFDAACDACRMSVAIRAATPEEAIDGWNAWVRRNFGGQPEPTLSPCPLCGRYPAASGGAKPRIGCACGAFLDGKPTLEELAAIWNRRAEPSPLSADPCPVCGRMDPCIGETPIGESFVSCKGCGFTIKRDGRDEAIEAWNGWRGKER